MAATIINPQRFRNAKSVQFNYILEDSQHIKDLTLDELYLNNMNIHLGTGTGNFITNQGTGAIAIGAYAGQHNQGNYSIAIGAYSGQINQPNNRSEEHTSELQSPGIISYAVFCLKK